MRVRSSQVVNSARSSSSFSSAMSQAGPPGSSRCGGLSAVTAVVIALVIAAAARAGLGSQHLDAERFDLLPQRLGGPFDGEL
ncbi:hypothetical protein ABZ719_26560 [Streptomyces sp. NPDC006743]|uniref:hypothetical protein n=1 Tax=Streptomyces sp. NPDC006743 TaxID=3154480 RepID=UPI003454205C